MEAHDSLTKSQKRLLRFFLLTFLFMIVELAYGLQSNSLGLVADSFHMLLDGASILLGLAASIVSDWPKNDSYPFGYARFQVLSGFVNGTVLLFISVYVLIESLERVFAPPTIESNYLTFVALCGLLVNVVGVVFFHDSHCHSHNHGETHNHGVCSHPDFNLRGVYLHIIADLLGSVGVLLSSLLMKFSGIMVADPICSLFVSLCILSSAIPLLTETGCILLQQSPPEYRKVHHDLMAHLRGIDGIERITISIWEHARGSNICCLHAYVHPCGEKNRIRNAVVAAIRGYIPFKTDIFVELDDI
jgi:zinc transporter 5/7